MAVSIDISEIGFWLAAARMQPQNPIAEHERDM
jgi:hypothetical protein